jgi:very-short-patch-repair endonuclease
VLDHGGAEDAADDCRPEPTGRASGRSRRAARRCARPRSLRRALKSDRSDCRALRDFAEWLVAFRRELLGAALTQRAVDVAAGRIDSAVIRAHVERLRDGASSLRDRLRALLDDVKMDERAAFGSVMDDVAFTAIAEVIDRWRQQTPALFHWSQFHAACKALRATPAAMLEPLVVADHLTADGLLPFFRASVAESLLRVALAERRALGQFAGDLHEKRIARFRELDRGLVELNRARLSRRLHAARPRLGGGASAQSEAGILLGELHRKRGHMPIRKLLARAGGLLQRIKPCFLMSPLSVAQFLDPRSAHFDLIVFDEASQVRPEDAVGALLRGSQLVVMGDTQQLPPTSFFDHLGAGDDGDPDEPDGAVLSDVESILHQCARSYPTKTLNWHYRSRHESLIAISNVHFYDEKLRVYPSAIDRDADLGLHFVHVPHAVYDRGGSGINRIEARVVAGAAIDHYRRFPERSLGIGTFNIKQQQAIQEELETQMRAHPELEELFKSQRREPLFVKNLETIQGDERDVILISLGFGRDAAGGLSLNFGPINKEGGERRLNVLISRARRKCVVYANFRGAELPVDRTASKGIFALQAFLEYAESRRLVRLTDVDDEPEPIADAVAAALREAGHEVKQRVGADAARVDVAVCDPRAPGRYLLGVLCDGENYHRSPVARDRDRLRQQVLENLGWRIHRLWSTDWYRNRAETAARLLRAVEEPPSAPAPPPSEVAPVAVAEEVAVPLVDEAPPYEVCRSLRLPRIGELHEVPPEHLAIAVEDVVGVEGPVHVEEVIRRIRTIWGLQRAGSRIREAIGRGAEVAQRRGAVAIDGEFLRIPHAEIRVRRRNGDPPARIDLIAEAELAAAVQDVLRTQFATPHADLIDATARRLGIQATTAAVTARLGTVIDAELARGTLTREGDRIRLLR